MVEFINVPAEIEKFLNTIKPLLEEIVEKEIGSVKVEFIFIDSEEMTKMNNRYRSKEGPTDVLTFIYGSSTEETIQEEINQIGEKEPNEISNEVGNEVSEEFYIEPYAEGYLCIDAIKENAHRFENTFQKELLTVLVHSILHMSGYDHEYNTKNAKEMFKKQDMYVTSIWKNLN